MVNVILPASYTLIFLTDHHWIEFISSVSICNISAMLLYRLRVNIINVVVFGIKCISASSTVYIRFIYLYVG